ncbi:MAG: hypothetical protein ACM3Q2_13870, partial [Syntrophothermus sp.]
THMKKLHLKVLLPLFISALVIFLNIRKAESCGPELEPDNFYTIFDKSLYNIPALKPFFLSGYIFADQSDGSEEALSDNLNDWVKFLHGVPSADHVERIIYSAGIDEIKQIRKYISERKNTAVTDELKENSFVKYLKNTGKTDVIDYIIFAKECEPEVSSNNQWDEKPKNTGLMVKLSVMGKSALRNARSSFIKERYAYQIIRLMHYSGKYKEAVNFYDKTFGKSKNRNLMKYWSLSHKAGALQSLGDTARSNLLFARVFENCRSRRHQCILSVKLNDETLINRTLKLCRNKDEKALVYTLIAYKNPYTAIEYIKPVFSLAPKSDYLILLLQRELTRLEREALPSKETWGGQRNYLKEREDQGEHQGAELFSTVSEIARSGKAGRAYLWNFAAGYIATLSGRTEEAKPFYFAAKKASPGTDISFIRRVQIAEIVNRAAGMKNIDKKGEDLLAGELEWLHKLQDEYQAKEALIYIMNKLAILYLKQNDMVKMNFCLGINLNQKYSSYGYYLNVHENAFGYDIKSDYQLEPIDDIYNVLAAKYSSDWYRKDSEYKKRFSAFDRFLIDNYSYTLNELAYIQAKSFIAGGQFDSAAAKLSSFQEQDYSGDNSEKLPADPFVVHIRDCHDCDFNAVIVNRYSVLSFARRMTELLDLAQKDTARAAEYYFLYANGLYNKSYYGNSWIASAFNRISDPWGYYEGFNYSFYDCSQAMKYYLKAMSLTKDRDFAAMCLYMASKCELNSYYNKPGSLEQERVPLMYRKFFSRLEEEYSDTKYYQEILKECRHFRNFVSR